MWKWGKSLVTCGREIWPLPLREVGLVVTHSRVWEAPVFTLHRRDATDSQSSKCKQFEQYEKYLSISSHKRPYNQEQEWVYEMCLLFNHRVSRPRWQMSCAESFSVIGKGSRFLGVLCRLEAPFCIVFANLETIFQPWSLMPLRH